jgi:hypothetical protein
MSATVEKNQRLRMGILMDARLPFGKYKNFTVRAIADADHQYLDWLLWQDWFIENTPTWCSRCHQSQLRRRAPRRPPSPSTAMWSRRARGADDTDTWIV